MHWFVPSSATFFAGKDIKNVELVFPPLFKPEREKLGVTVQVMLLNMTILQVHLCCFIALKEKYEKCENTIWEPIFHYFKWGKL